MGLENEWYTPARFTQSARRVMGGIDLDPASCLEANRYVQASRIYDEKENGLLQSWYGRVWLNPPYGSTGINHHGGSVHTGVSRSRLFIERLYHFFSIGAVEQAVALLRFDAKSVLMQTLLDYLVCLCKEDIEFHTPDGSLKRHRFGTVFLYLGPYQDAFIAEFAQYGRIVTAIDGRPKPVHIQMF